MSRSSFDQQVTQCICIVDTHVYMRNIEKRDDIPIYSKKCSVYRVCRVYKMRNIENSRVHFKQIYTMTKSYANTMGFFYTTPYKLPIAKSNLWNRNEQQ